METPQSLKEASVKLEKQLGVHVGSAYGLGHKTSEDAKWFIIVWSDKPVYAMPTTFEGYPVVRYNIPRAL